MTFHAARLTSTSQPKFLSREERAKLAIAKRAQEIKAEKSKEEETRRARDALEREAEDVRRRERERDYPGGGGGRYGGRCESPRTCSASHR